MRKRRFVTVLVLLSSVAGTAAAGDAAGPEWHAPYAGGGGVWRKRIVVEVASQSAQELMGTPVFLTVGGTAGQARSGTGEIALAGANAKDIRVCSAGGVDLGT